MVAAWYLPRGRIRRRRWWLGYVVAFVLLGLLTTWFDARFLPGAHPRVRDTDGFDVLWPFPDEGGPVTTITGLVLLMPNVAALVCRLHDRDHSAWWLLWFLVPLVGWLVLVVTVGLLRGTPGPNPYGQDPRTSGGAAWTS
ncbi:DUF805 domain-containing protein [Klenkia brasiliensis]|uniref:Uncharacterized membrane protein YhaH, DUF805 family n=1 Tax=Klenkia brasiliensis TaxID=333142 RepID=A0A1G7RC35_9ACTN|nr:DUF805 domain-containing protein [Klenkia brasiliensis]SDG08356.1 Uncharacterized membrane protein YhaH, DUF805 family [Klenkia brasiliensis]